MDLNPRDLPARTGGRLVAATSVLVSAGAVHLLLDVTATPHPWLVPLVAAFVTGVVVSFAPGTDGWFRRASGVALGWGAFLMLTAASLVAGIGAGEPLHVPQAVGLLPLVVVGADWHRVGRLQTSVLLPGVGVVLALARAVGDDGATVAQTAGPVLAWLLAAMGAFAVLQCDCGIALTRPAPTSAGGPGPPRVPVGELAGVAAAAAAAALVLAFALTSPAWSPFHGGQEQSGSPAPGAGGTTTGAPGGTGAAADPGSPGGGAGPVDPEAGGNVYVDGAGGVYVYDGESGDFVSVPEEAQVDSRGRLWPPQADPRTLPGDAPVVGGDARDGNLVTPDGRPLVPRDPSGRALAGEGDTGGAGTGVDNGAEEGTVGTTGGEGGAGSVGGTTDSPPGRRATWPLGAALAALVGGATLALWWWRGGQALTPTPGSREWSASMTRRIEVLGAARGRTRRSDETLAAYGTDLAARTDGRMVDVAAAVSAGLFGPAEPDEDVRGWVEQTLTEWEADHHRRADKVAARFR